VTNSAIKKAAAKAAAKYLDGGKADAKLAPAKVSRALAAKVGRAVEGLVYPVYWREEGARDPIPGKTPKARANALVRRAKLGVRFEILAASYGAALGRAVGVAEVKRVLREAGYDPDTRYAGRGTRSSALGEGTRVSQSA